MQRLFNIDKWHRVEADTAIHFGNPTPRRVRIDVNAPGTVQLFYADGNGETTFLATVTGRDIIEFGCAGEFSILTSGSDCYIYTVDGEDFSFAIPDAQVLTKIIERRARNPELEMMQFMMNQNIQRRMDQQREELEQLWARREAAAAAAAAEPAPSGGTGGSGGEPAPTSGTDVQPVGDTETV